MKRDDCFAAALLGLLVVIFFWDSIFAGKIFCMRDMFFDYVPWRDFARQAISEGHFPLWNSCSSLGQPFMAEPQTAILYPFSLFHYTLSMKWALKINLIFHMLVASVSIYFLMRRWTFDVVPSILTAICFSFNTYMVAQMEYAIFTTVCWTPLVFLATVLLIEKVRLFRKENQYCNIKLFIPEICFLTVVLSVQFLSGYIQAFLYTLIMLFIYITINSLFLKDIKHFIHSIFLFMLSCVFTMGIVMVQVLLTWENIAMSIRSGLFDPGLKMASLHPIYFFSSLAPFLFGRPGYPDQWLTNFTVFEFWIGTFYIGILPLIIISILPFRKLQEKNDSKKQKFVALLFFCLVTIFFGLIMSFGEYTPIYYIFFKYFPLFNILRWPSKFLFLVVFAASILTGLGYQRLSNRITNGKINKIIFYPLIFWALCFFFLCFMCLYPDIYSGMISSLLRVPMPFMNHFVPNAINELHSAVLFTGLSIAVVAFLIFSKSSLIWLAHILIIAVVFTNLALVGRDIHYIADDDIYSGKPPFV
ncbi:MAG: hypothetical protein ABSB79_14395, partial [Syntrophales bacterium]